jgi:hypothetical protein
MLVRCYGHYYISWYVYKIILDYRNSMAIITFLDIFLETF